jgi:hypothetical protein
MRGNGKTLVASVLACIIGIACARPGVPPASQSVRAVAPSEPTITTSGVTAADGGWMITRDAAGSVPLFEVPAGLEQTTLTYRARLKARDVRGKAYLEMWVRVPGRGEFFSRGLDQPLHGTSDWASYEIPFFLNEAGARVDLVKLNVAFEGGGGAVWIKDVELLQTPLG